MANVLQTYFDQERGRSVRLAIALGITPGAVSQWDRVPAERVAEVEQVTGIPRALLRPDLFAAGNTTLKKVKELKQPNALASHEDKPRKSIIGCMKGMATLPADFNPSEPFWSEPEDWGDGTIGGLDSK